MMTDAHTHILAKGNASVTLLCLSAARLRGLSDNPSQALQLLATELGVAQPDRCLLGSGLHPFDVGEAPEKDWLEALLALPELRFVGEIGLHRPSSHPWARQMEWLDIQLSAAQQLHKPVVLHCVHAAAEILACRRKYPSIPVWMIHGFRGKPQQARQWTAQGFYLSFGPRFNSESLKACPPDRLLLETDAETPGRMPEISAVYQQAAAVLSVPLPELERQVADNVRAFTGLV